MTIIYLFCALSLAVQAAALWQLLAIRRCLPPEARVPGASAPEPAPDSEKQRAEAKRQADLEAGIGAILAYGLDEMTRRPGDAL